MRLMSFCTRPMVAAKIAVVAPMKVTKVCAFGASSNSGDSRATMKTPAVTMVAAWISADTGVGPSIASGSQVCSRNCADLPIAPMNSSRQMSVSASACQPKKSMNLAGQSRRLREDSVEIDGAGHREQREDAERKAEVADAVDDEGLDRGSVGLGLLVPEADQQIAGEPHAFPAEKHLHQIVGGHQHQHREGEQRQIAEEARAIRVFVHVADRIEMHDAGDRVHHHQHHRGQRVDAQRPGDLQVARDDPVEDRHPDVVAAEADLRQRDPGQDHRHREQRRGDQFDDARTGRGRLDRTMTVGMVVAFNVRMVDDAATMRVGCVMTRMRVRRRGAVVARRRRLARKAGARAKQRDQAGKNGPEQR